MTDFSKFFQYPNVQGIQDEVFFSKFTPEVWAKVVPYTDTILLAKDDIVINYQDTEYSLYILLEGSCSVLAPDNKGNYELIAYVEPGSVIGELGFFDGKPRGATVRVDTPSTVLRMSIDSFRRFAAKEPPIAIDFLYELGKIIASRLRTCNERLYEIAE